MSKPHGMSKIRLGGMKCWPALVRHFNNSSQRIFQYPTVLTHTRLIEEYINKHPAVGGLFWI